MDTSPNSNRFSRKAAILEQGRVAAAAREALQQRIDAVADQDKQIGDALARFTQAKLKWDIAEHINEQIEPPLGFLNLLPDTEQALASFCKLMRDFGRVKLFDQIDLEQAGREYHHKELTPDEATAAYGYAAAVFQEVLDGSPIDGSLRQGWQTNNWNEYKTRIIRYSLQPLAVIMGCVAPKGRLIRKSLIIEDVVRLAKSVRERYVRMTEWTVAELFWAGFDLETLDLELGLRHVELPRPLRWDDGAVEASVKLDRIIEALQRSADVDVKTDGSSNSVDVRPTSVTVVRPAEQEAKGQNGSSSVPGAKASSSKKKRGRPARTAKEVGADIRLYEDYLAANRNSGSTKPEFIRNRFRANEFDEMMTRLNTGRKDYRARQKRNQ